jgi:acetyl esterase/lipase
MARAFAARGYVAVSINYRLLAPPACGGGNPPPECFTAAFAAQHDGQAAVRWLRSHARRLHVDGSRIAIGGSSAGAVTAVLVGARPDDPGDSGNPRERSSVGAVISVSGGVPNAANFDRRDAPTLFFHGDQDGVVPYAWAQTDARALAGAGVPAVLETLKGAGHVPWDRYGDRFVKHSAWFAYTQLRLVRLPSP